MILLSHGQAVDAVADERASKIILAAIGDFSRATGNVGRITDPVARLKALRMLADFAVHLTARIEAEINLLPGMAGQISNSKEEN